jgi:hypothetical protein
LEFPARYFCPWAILPLLVACPEFARAADRIILRNLEIIQGRSVVSLDEDGVRLDVPRPTGSDRLTWDEIERGTVALDQGRFDELLTELGTPLFRIRQRLKIGDYEALAEPAEKPYPRYDGRKSPTAYMVAQAVMWSRLASGQREAAVEPYLRSFELLRSGAAKIAGIPGSRRLQLHAKSAISTELLPAWFDAEAAARALPDVEKAIRAMAQPRPEGVYLYYASLAMTANQPAEAERVLRTFKGEEKLAAEWREILLVQEEAQSGRPGPHAAALAEKLDELADSSRPGGLYWLGLSRLTNSDTAVIRDGVLDLLTLPAQYGRQQPDLAAAGLYHAAGALDKLKDAAASAALRQELAREYPSTHHGRKSAGEASAR